MNTVTVQASRSYEIRIGSGAIQALPGFLRTLPGLQKLCIVSDDNVFPLWGETVRALTAEYDCCSFVFPAGEDSKNGETYFRLLDLLAREQLTRKDCILALGGGVVGDLSGFAAATYLRGIPFLQIPTSLLAMVDSSVGGKTAIDLPAGKNLCGAFWQPLGVFCDLDFLSTLPRPVFLEGCAEVIKYAVLYDPALFAHLEQAGPDFDREAVITRCIQWKRDVVQQDEFDTGLRMKLNLGHTLGHGVEAASGYTVSHGRAVAIGTAIITRSAQAKGLCTAETRDRILSLLKVFSLPTDTDYPENTLFFCALSDKKRAGNSVSLIVPREIGNCELRKVSIEDLNLWIQAGL